MEHKPALVSGYAIKQTWDLIYTPDDGHQTE